MLRPAPGTVLLRFILTDPTVPGGVVTILESTRANWTANQYEIAAVGDLTTCPDLTECDRPEHDINFGHPFVAAAGDWVLIRHRRAVPTDDPTLFSCKQDDVLAVIEAAPSPPAPPAAPPD